MSSQDEVNIGQLLHNQLRVLKSGNVGKFEMIGSEGVRVKYQFDPTDADMKEMAAYAKSYIEKLIGRPVVLENFDCGYYDKEGLQREQEAYQAFLKKIRK